MIVMTGNTTSKTFLCLLLGAIAAAAQTPFSASVTVELPDPRGGGGSGRSGAPANPYLLGNNLEWANFGDGMLVPNTLNFAPPSVQAAQQLGPTILRYPGGTLSDTYHWKDGMGLFATRGTNFLPTGSCPPPSPPNPPISQKVLMGTQEFLELSESTGALPLITVNVITGTTQEAAAWVRQTNITGLISRITGRRLPSVLLWEIGNEPYLKNGALPPDQDISPGDFAIRVNQFVTAMKAVDPTIRVILPLRSDTIGGVPVTTPGYNNAVLGGLTVPVDYVAVHDAYGPLVLESPTPMDQDLYLATMAAATQTVIPDLQATQSAISSNPHTVNSGITVTEYNALYTLPSCSNPTPRPSDSYIKTLAGALYVADVLRVFATTNVSFANFWSLSQNYHFGAFDSADPNGNPRPAFWSLVAYKQLLQGLMAHVTVEGPVFSNIKVGVVPASNNTPTVAAIATLQGSTLRILIINKDKASTANLTINTSSRPQPTPTGTMTYLGLTGPTYFAFENALSISQGTVAVGPFPFQFPLGPHSFILLTVPLN